MVNCDLRKNWNDNICKRKVGEAEFRIIVPKNDNAGRPIRMGILNIYQNKMNKIFGGSTVITKTKGCYTPENSPAPACENNFILMATRDFENPYTTPSKKNYNSKQREKQLEEDYMKVKALGRKMAKELGQDTIFVEQVPLVDASMVKRKKSWKSQLPFSKVSDYEAYSDY